MNVLDLGLGTGRFLEKLRACSLRPIHPYWLDISHKMIDVARLRTIGAGYDGSREGERALALARELATERGAEVSAFQALRDGIEGRFDRP